MVQISCVGSGFLSDWALYMVMGKYQYPLELDWAMSKYKYTQSQKKRNFSSWIFPGAQGDP